MATSPIKRPFAIKSEVVSITTDAYAKFYIPTAYADKNIIAMYSTTINQGVFMTSKVNGRLVNITGNPVNLLPNTTTNVVVVYFEEMGGVISVLLALCAGGPHEHFLYRTQSFKESDGVCHWIYNLRRSVLQTKDIVQTRQIPIHGAYSESECGLHARGLYIQIRPEHGSQFFRESHLFKRSSYRGFGLKCLGSSCSRHHGRVLHGIDRLEVA